MRRFEYKVLHYYEELDEETTRQWNELGKEGWELVGFAPYAMEVSNEINEFELEPSLSCLAPHPTAIPLM